MESTQRIKYLKLVLRLTWNDSAPLQICILLTGTHWMIFRNKWLLIYLPHKENKQTNEKTTTKTLTPKTPNQPAPKTLVEKVVFQLLNVKSKTFISALPR